MSKEELIVDLPVSEIHSFIDHPFEVRDDDAMKETIQSVKDYGVITPVIVRPTDYGCYEMISGHRRMLACELAGIETIPAIVRNVDRDTAIIMMVDSNLYTGESAQFKRQDVIGTLEKDKLSDWAKEGLEKVLKERTAKRNNRDAR